MSTFRDFITESKFDAKEFLKWHDNADNYKKHDKYIDAMYAELQKRGADQKGNVDDAVKKYFNSSELSKLSNDVKKMENGKVIKFSI